MSFHLDESKSNRHLVRGYVEQIPGLAKKTPMTRMHNEITLHELWQILLKRRTTFFLCVAVAILAAIGFSLILPTKYEAVGRLTVDFDSQGAGELGALGQAVIVDVDTRLQTQVNVLRTDALAWDVITRLRLDQRPELAHRRFFFGKPKCIASADQTPDSLGPECRRTLLDEFHEGLRVQSVPKTEIIEIRFRSKSKELAANIVNTLSDTYIEKNFQTKYEAALRPSSWLSGQLNEVKRDAEQAEEQLIAYQKKTGIFGTDENHNVVIERLNDINQQLAGATANRIVREARYRVAMNGDPESLVELAPGSLLQVLHTEEAGLKNQYAQLDAKYGDAYPKVVEVKAQLEQAAEATRVELDRTRQKIKDEYQAAVKTESMLRDDFEEQKRGAYDTNEATVQAAFLKHDVDATRELYEQLVKRLKEAGIIAGLKASNVNIIDPADVPVRPVEPRPAMNLALGLLAGSLSGFGLCFLLENIDTRIASPNDVADVGSLPSLGIVPRLSDGLLIGKLVSGHRNGAERAALEQPESEVADAYRSLRTALLLSNAGSPPKVLLITSPLPREGKTTTSVNTAVVFAQKKRRVLLVDGDLRRGDLYRCFDLPSNGGLSAALTGEDPAQFYVPHPELSTLFILPAGARPPKPPDLLDSDRMREIVAQWRQEFDHVIIDAPPIIGLSDSVIMATMADTVVLVVRAQQSRRQDLCRAREILASVNAKVGGAIINDFVMHSTGPYGFDTALYGRYFESSKRKNGNAHV